jgi:hypothetical protein
LLAAFIQLPFSPNNFKACLVPYGIQNSNYFKMTKCKMSKLLKLYLVSSKMQNLLPLLWPLEVLLGFLPLKAKSKMENSHHFAKNFAWYLISLCKMEKV